MVYIISSLKLIIMISLIFLEIIMLIHHVLKIRAIKSNKQNFNEYTVEENNQIAQNLKKMITKMHIFEIIIGVYDFIMSIVLNMPLFLGCGIIAIVITIIKMICYSFIIKKSVYGIEMEKKVYHYIIASMILFYILISLSGSPVIVTAA